MVMEVCPVESVEVSSWSLSDQVCEEVTPMALVEVVARHPES